MRPINGNVRIPRFWTYPTTKTVQKELADPDFSVGAVLPAIIPPGEKFSKNIPPFRQIEKSVKDVLSQIDSLVFIGWSMRQSDKKYQNLFALMRAIRKNKLNATAVCNFHQKKEFYQRFENILPTKKFLFCDDGFMRARF